MGAGITVGFRKHPLLFVYVLVLKITWLWEILKYCLQIKGLIQPHCGAVALPQQVDKPCQKCTETLNHDLKCVTYDLATTLKSGSVMANLLSSSCASPYLSWHTCHLSSLSSLREDTDSSAVLKCLSTCHSEGKNQGEIREYWRIGGRECWCYRGKESFVSIES